MSLIAVVSLVTLVKINVGEYKLERIPSTFWKIERLLLDSRDQEETLVIEMLLEGSIECLINFRLMDL